MSQWVYRVSSSMVLWVLWSSHAVTATEPELFSDISTSVIATAKSTIRVLHYLYSVSKNILHRPTYGTNSIWGELNSKRISGTPCSVASVREGGLSYRFQPQDRWETYLSVSKRIQAIREQSISAHESDASVFQQSFHFWWWPDNPVVECHRLLPNITWAR